jgi:Acetyltransferases
MIDIRLLTAKDWQVWKAIRLEALQTHPEAFASSYAETALLDDKAFEHDLIRSDIFGAFSDQYLVGCAGFFIASPLKLQHRGTLTSLYVKPTSRGQHIGDQLVKTVIHHARPKVLQLHCMVTTDNQTAITLYRNNGFTIYGTEPRALHLNSQFYDEHFMVLKLA